MERLLRTSRPVLIVEVHPLELKKLGVSARQVYDLLCDSGYTMSTPEHPKKAVEFESLPNDTNYWLLGRFTANTN
jgi:hypothetical protein